MTTETHNLINAVEDVKEKLNDQEYKTILDTTMKIHNQDRSQPAVEAQREPTPQTDVISEIMELLGGYNFRAYQRIISTDEDTRNRLFHTIKGDILSLQRHKEFVEEQRDFRDKAYYWMPNNDIEDTIKDLTTLFYNLARDIPGARGVGPMLLQDSDCFAKDRILFSYYMGDDAQLIDQPNREAIAEWFEWIEDDEDDDDDCVHYLEIDHIYNNETYSDDRYTIKEWYEKMLDARLECFRIASWIEDLSSY
tara:strand:+ start:130 stop:882 length:753 start_codon:yes stop_codon:yes gene_type:complete